MSAGLRLAISCKALPPQTPTWMNMVQAHTRVHGMQTNAHAVAEEDGYAHTRLTERPRPAEPGSQQAAGSADRLS